MDKIDNFESLKLNFRLMGSPNPTNATITKRDRIRNWLYQALYFSKPKFVKHLKQTGQIKLKFTCENICGIYAYIFEHIARLSTRLEPKFSDLRQHANTHSCRSYDKNLITCVNAHIQEFGISNAITNQCYQDLGLILRN